MKTVGIIGGLGPETTAQFYLQVISKAKLINSNHRPAMMIWNVPMDLKTEKSFIKGGDQNQAYTQLLVDAAKRLEKAGVDFIVIPCNSVHIFINEIRQAVQIPVLSIVEETENFLVENSISKIGLLATSATINSHLYDQSLENKNIQVVLPSQSEQVDLDLSITRLVDNESSEQEREKLQDIITTLSNRGVQTTLLACTDLQLIAPLHPTVAIYDTMLILVDKTARMIFED